MVEVLTTTVAVEEGFSFGEGPRFRDGAFFISDQYQCSVFKVEEDSDGKWTKRKIHTVENQPSGIGWLPDGRMLVVSMKDRRLLVEDEDGTSLPELADLSSLASGECNDMVTTVAGRSYLGNFGFDMFGLSLLQKLRFNSFLLLHFFTGKALTSMLPKDWAAELICVEANGAARIVAEGLYFPNGTVISQDGKTLVVAETFAARLTAFSIDEETGDLSNRRVWATCPPGAVPDGICLDAKGGIWVASLATQECLRIEEGGNVTHRVRTTQPPFACMIGTSRKSKKSILMICTAPSHYREVCEAKGNRGKLEYVEIPYAKAGWP